MADDDLRYYKTFYGIHVNKWDVDFGSGAFSDHHKILVEDYISDGCETTETSDATDTNKFIYPHHIKKVYFIEGVIIGQITVAASDATSTVTSYRVTVCKVNTNGDEDELFTTGTITVSDTLDWDSSYSIGEETVYPFWIDAWEYEKLDQYDRIYVKVEINSDNNAVLYHSNDATWEDLKIEIPFRM